MTVLLAMLVLVSAPVQAAITTALFRDPLAAPVLPAALIAAWAVMRRPDETWPAVLLPAVVLGATSEERAGWFLLALLPAPIFALAASSQVRPFVTGFWRRLGLAAAVAAAAAVSYALVLSASAGVLGEAPARAPELLAAAAGSALIAALAALAFWPLRPRRRGLFA